MNFVNLSSSETELGEVDSEGFRLQIGSETFFPDRSAVVKAMMNQEQSFVVVKVIKIYTFEGIKGVIEVSLIGRINNYGTPDAMSDMNVVGHGSGYFEGVKIKAVGHNEDGNIDHKLHIGTIMGWQDYHSLDLISITKTQPNNFYSFSFLLF